MAEESEKKSNGQEDKPKLSPAAIGWGLILLILAGYFIWMTLQMGKAAVSGAAPMIAFLGAAAVGIAAAGLAFAIGRRKN
jgi:apolipoprotein N-acyltransferase